MRRLFLSVGSVCSRVAAARELSSYASGIIVRCSSGGAVTLGACFLTSKKQQESCAVVVPKAQVYQCIKTTCQRVSYVSICMSVNWRGYVGCGVNLLAGAIDIGSFPVCVL